MKEKIKTILLIGLIGILVTSSVSALGIGIAPMSFTIDDAQRGGVCDQSLMVYNVDGETMINMIEVPGSSSEKIIARFTIPSETANGSHTGAVSVQTIPEIVTENVTTGGAAAHAVLRMASEGTIMVTGMQNLSGTVTNITAMDTEVNNTLLVKVEFQNTGDVIANPAINVSIAINESVVDCFVYDQTGVMPGVNETIAVEWNTTGQIPGNYSVNVSVSLNSDILATKNLSVRILSPGTLTPEVPKGEPSTEM
jgi:hypothetical protein